MYVIKPFFVGLFYINIDLQKLTTIRQNKQIKQLNIYAVINIKKLVNILQHAPDWSTHEDLAVLCFINLIILLFQLRNNQNKHIYGSIKTSCRA